MQNNSLIDRSRKKKLKTSAFNIQIEKNFSDKAKLLWFSLINKIYPYLKLQNNFYVPISELKKDIADNSKNNIGIKKLLRELKSVNIEWRINSRYGDTWELSSLLSDCRIITGTDVIEFSISSFLQEKLWEPDVYLKLNLLISKRFKSKNTLSIYRLILDNMHLSAFHTVKNFSLREIREYLGLKGTEYFKPGELLKHVIKKSEEDINGNTDLKLKIFTIRTEREKITGFQLDASVKPEYIKRYKAPKLVEPEKPKEFTVKEKASGYEPVTIQSQELNSFFARYSISLHSKSIQERLRTISTNLRENRLEDFLLYLMKFAEQELRSGSVKKMGGFFINQVKDDLQVQKFVIEQENQAKREQEQKEEKKTLLKKKLKSRYEAFMTSDFREYIENNIDRLEPKVIEILKQLTAKDSIITRYIAKHNDGVIDKTLITDTKPAARYMILGHLRHYADDLGYRLISFDEWKSQVVNNDLLAELEKEIAGEL